MDNTQSSKGLASDFVYKTLYDKIISLDLKPGEIISPTQLSKELGISRTPIQRACIKLAANGLLDVLPQRGSYVSLINLNKVYESFYMRNLLEQAAISVVCRLEDRSYICSQLELNIISQEQKLKDRKYSESFAIDEEFHHTIYEAAGMLYIESAMAQISSDQNRLRQLNVNSGIQNDPTLKQHQNILESIRNGDTDAASFNTYIHISKFATDCIKLHQQFPNYFSNWNEKNLLPQSTKQTFYNF